MTVPNVLATRYAAEDLAAIWSPEHKIVLERQLWIAVLTAQRELGIDEPKGVIEAYEAAVYQVDLESIAARERITRHDVKARIEEFSALDQLTAGPSNLATTIRLMAGIELVTEGFKEGQVGSSAMPHKMNTRSCERVNGLAVITRGYLSMVGELAGDQWNEGDVSCSVVRRVALPDAFFAVDGLFQTFLTVLDEFGAFPAVIQRELDRYLPFLATTKVLMSAVRNGVGREVAHEAIKEAAVGTALAMRQGQSENDVFAKLSTDPRLGLTRSQIEDLVADPITFTGAAVAQTQEVVRRVEALIARHPAAAAYMPGSIL